MRHYLTLGLLLTALAPSERAAGGSGCAAPFAVGTATASYADPARAGRAVAVRVHYPAVVAGSGSAALTGCGFPLVAFGHGFTIGNGSYPYLADGLAAAGYIVVLPGTESGLSPDHAQFGRDLSFVLQATASAPQWQAAAGPRRAIGGHSMGGGAAVLALAGAPAVDALFALAPAETNPSAIAAAATISAPSLLITGSRDCVAPTAQHAGPIHAALATPATAKSLVDINGASHCQFSGASLTCSIGEQSCGGSATITASDQQGQTLALLLPWLQQVLGAGLAFADGFE